MGQGNKQKNEAPVTQTGLGARSTPYTVQVSPPSGLPSGGTAPSIVPSIVVGQQKPKPRGDTVPVRGSLQLTSQKQTDTVNTPLPPVFYVIVGRGPASAIDHTTLLQSAWGKDRIDKSDAGKLPVLHIGFFNPWSRFFSHGMGQPTYLLGLPGFHPENQPNIVGKNAIKDGGLTSTVFGGCVDAELEWCYDQERKRWEGDDHKAATFKPYDWPVLNGWVGWIQDRSLEELFKPEDIGKEQTGSAIQSAMTAELKKPFPNFPYGVAPYRLLVLRDRTGDGTMTAEFVYAQNIDFCTGSGRPRQDKKDYKTARLEPWRDPATWQPPLKQRKIVVAAEAVRQELDWPSGQRVCVGNGGAIGLNAAERSRDESCWTDWFHTTSLMEPFGNPRNFTFLRNKAGTGPRALGEGGRITEPELIAADERVRMGRSTDVEKAEESGAVVTVTLKKGVPRGDPPPKLDDPLIRDHQRNEAPLDLVNKQWAASPWYGGQYNSATGKTLPSQEYARVIFHSGLVTTEVGQPYHTGCKGKLITIYGDGRMVGMQTPDGKVRILGAAAQMYPELDPFDPKNPGYSNSDKMWQFRQILPVSAVPDGFILSGINIAAANHFFTPFSKNTNVNTMSQDEIEDALRRGGVPVLEAGKLAKSIVEARNAGNGFEDFADLKKKLMKKEQGKVDAANKVSVEGLKKQSMDEYLAKRAEWENKKKALPDLDIAPLLEAMEKAEVAKQTGLSLFGAEKVAADQQAAAENAAELNRQLTSHEDAITKALHFAY